MKIKHVVGVHPSISQSGERVSRRHQVIKCSRSCFIEFPKVCTYSDFADEEETSCPHSEMCQGFRVFLYANPCVCHMHIHK